MEALSKELMKKELKTLNVASCSITEFFSNDSVKYFDGDISGQLTIPEYQRPYTWQAKELGKLLNDLLSYFKNSNGTQTNHKYYLGSIILHQEVFSDNKRLNVIDGQQRLTSLAILAYWLDHDLQPEITYNAPSSQQQIVKNIKFLNDWLAEQHVFDLTALKKLINFDNINVTLVVTDSEDDAYRFFETQNTGGVRLNGADIIKAHHLRATKVNIQDNYARQWESLGELSPLLDAVMKVRYWQTFKFKDLPSHRAPSLVKNEVVKELSERCDNDDKTNVAYRSIKQIKQGTGWLLSNPEDGYAMRQPLNSGVNTIDYLSYFAKLQQTILIKNSPLPDLEDFNAFYSHEVIQDTHGTAYLKKMFDSALLLYISQFGTSNLYEASLWLFRMVYSPRVINQKAVRESTIQKFAREKKLYDFIVMSYSHAQLITWLKDYPYECENSNATKNTKGGFIGRVEKFLNIDMIDRSNINLSFDKALVNGINRKISVYQQSHQGVS